MITFLDGPAAGANLRLFRVPILLRVVVSPHGKVDALDQPEDEARPMEKIYVYRLTGKPTWMHMRCSKRSESGFYWMAEYKLLEEQPEDEVLRFNEEWVAWCEANRARLMPEWAKQMEAEKTK